jgi:hypothetical protein
MAKQQFICLGRAPLDGCGISLTIIERRTFGESCEHCELAWQERWRAWCLGASDSDLDDIFAGEPGVDGV